MHGGSCGARGTFLSGHAGVDRGVLRAIWRPRSCGRVREVVRQRVRGRGRGSLVGRVASPFAPNYASKARQDLSKHLCNDTLQRYLLRSCRALSKPGILRPSKGRRWTAAQRSAQAGQKDGGASHRSVVPPRLRPPRALAIPAQGPSRCLRRPPGCAAMPRAPPWCSTVTPRYAPGAACGGTGGGSPPA